MGDANGYLWSSELCEPSRTALIVHDLEVGVAWQISSGGTVTERCAALLAHARKAGFSVYFTRHQCPVGWPAWVNFGAQ
jgi:hypothetical protein